MRGTIPPRRVRESLLSTCEEERLTFLLDLRYTGVWNAAMLQSNDFMNGLMAAMSKKKPTFEKL